MSVRRIFLARHGNRQDFVDPRWLDQAACEGMTRYARYNPALDDAGNPTTGSASTTIVYQLSR